MLPVLSKPRGSHSKSFQDTDVHSCIQYDSHQRVARSSGRGEKEDKALAKASSCIATIIHVLKSWYRVGATLIFCSCPGFSWDPAIT